MIRRLIKRLLAGVPVLAFACGPFADPMSAESGDPNCGTDALAKLIAGRAIDLSEACRPDPVEKCGRLLRDPVEAKWAPRFEAWERCGQ